MLQPIQLPLKTWGRLDLLAYKLYQDPSYWWAIALVNNIGNQLTDMYVGQVLTLPSQASLFLALSENAVK